MVTSADAMFVALYEFIVEQAKSLGYTEEDCIAATKSYHRDKYGMYMFMSMPDNNVMHIVYRAGCTLLSGGISDCKEEE